MLFGSVHCQRESLGVELVLTYNIGDMLNPNKKYNLEYYLGVVDKIVAMGAHIVGIKDSSCPQSFHYIPHQGLRLPVS